MENYFTTVVKYINIISKYRDLIYIALLIIFGAIMSFQVTKIGNLNKEIARQENNIKALTDTLTIYKDDLGRVNMEKHAYQLTQEELRDSIGLLKKKNMEYLTYINSQMNISDTITIETEIERIITDTIDNGSIKFNKSDVFGKSSRSFSADIPYYVDNNKLYTGNTTFTLNQDIFVEGWLERNTKTKETYMHLRSDYPGLTFNSGMGIVAESSKSYERSMRKSFGVGVAIGPNFSLSKDLTNNKFVPTIGVGITVGLTYTPKILQW